MKEDIKYKRIDIIVNRLNSLNGNKALCSLTSVYSQVYSMDTCRMGFIFQDDDTSKQSATTGPFPWTLWPDATTISKERAMNGNKDNVDGRML